MLRRLKFFHDFSHGEIRELLKAGSRPLFEDTPLSGGSAGGMYREMMLEEVARHAAGRDALGTRRLLGPVASGATRGEE